MSKRKKTEQGRIVKALVRAKLLVNYYPKIQFDGNVRLETVKTPDVEFIFNADSGRLISVMPSMAWLERQLTNPGFVSYVLDNSPLLEPSGQQPTTAGSTIVMWKR